MESQKRYLIISLIGLAILVVVFFWGKTRKKTPKSKYQPLSDDVKVIPEIQVSQEDIQIKTEEGSTVVIPKEPLIQFDIDAQVKKIRKAMFGSGSWFDLSSWGTDEEALFEVLDNLPTEYIPLFEQRYKAKYDTNLVDDLKSELSGNDLQRALQKFNG